jgi:hypothetical protein
LPILTPEAPPALEEAVLYAASFDPSFPSRLRGATGAQLDELESLAGSPLPPPFRALLERMGESDGGTALMQGSSFRAADLIDLYRTAAEDWREPLLPPGYLLFAVPPREGRDDLLVLDARAPALAPVLGLDSQRSAPRPVAASLIQLLFRLLFLRLAIPAHPHRRRQWSTLAHARPTLDEVAEYARARGLTPLWFSDAQIFCAESDGARLAIGRSGGDTLWLSMSAAARSAADALELGMKLRFRLAP